MLSSQAEFHQLVKIPVLVAHFAEHQSKDQDITFADFIAEHYRSGAENDSEHEDLPFKSHECQHHAGFVYCADMRVESDFFHSNSDDHYGAFLLNRYASEKLSAVWQPPQFS